MKSFKIIVLLAVFISSCASDPTARPNGFLRIGMPQKNYIPLPVQGCQFSSTLNSSAKIIYKDSANCWIDIVYPTILSTIQLTYKPVEDNLQELFLDAQKLAYKHTVKATGMREQIFSYDSARVFGMYYEMSGASATTTQFYATDSSHHFLRGVLYHYSTPNPDSLAPVTSFMRGEMQEFISNLYWTNE
jgi:gliding motility-associated lipoprotein GldD